jgi:RarD protein
MRKKIDRKAIADNRISLLCAGTFLGINWILLFEAYKRTTIAGATLAYYMAPVIFLLLSFFIMKTKLTAIRIMTISLSFFGLIILQMEDFTIYGNMYSIGIAFGLAAAFFYALVIIFNRRMNRINGLDRTFMELFLSLVVLTLYMAATNHFSDFVIPEGALIYVLILGILHTGLAYFLYFSTVDRLDSQHVALISYIDPMSAIIFSALFLDEKVYFNMILGALLILGSSILFELIGIKEQRRS